MSCARAHGDLGKRLLTAVRCGFDVASAQIHCEESVRKLIKKFVKSLPSAKLTKTGLLDLRSIKKSLRPWARLHNDVFRAVLRRTAPYGVRTPQQIWKKIEEAREVWKFFRDTVPDIARAMSATDFNELAEDLAHIAGLDSCVDFLVAHA